MKKVYVASSWRNDYYKIIVDTLRAKGHAVFDWRNPPTGGHGFSWTDVSPKWHPDIPVRTDDYIDMLNHPIAEAGYASDLSGMVWANTCVLLLPCGRSAHTEAGYMCGRGKPVHVLRLDPQEPDLMYKLFDSICGTTDELLTELDK